MQRVPDTIGRERMWKVVSTVTGMVAALLARKVIRAAYRVVSNETDPATPFDPADARFSWADALLWAAAAGIGLGIAKVVSARVASLGWKVATGTPPPGLGEEPSVV